jgi:hypothetical protein
MLGIDASPRAGLYLVTGPRQMMANPGMVRKPISAGGDRRDGVCAGRNAKLCARLGEPAKAVIRCDRELPDKEFRAIYST